MNIKRTVREFISANFYIDDPNEFTDSNSFLDHGIVDSTGILEVVAFLEETFAITVDDADLTPENFDTIDGIVTFVTHKQAPPPAMNRTLRRPE